LTKDVIFVGCLKNHFKSCAYFLAKKERRFAMRQKSYFGSAKERKFEDGVLRVDACFGRHSLPRRFQEQFPSEDNSSSFGSSAVWEERRLQNKVAILLSKGFKPSASESLEDFVQKHADVLEEVI
jgi:hypothetical protein